MLTESGKLQLLEDKKLWEFVEKKLYFDLGNVRVKQHFKWYCLSAVFSVWFFGPLVLDLIKFFFAVFHFQDGRKTPLGALSSLGRSKKSSEVSVAAAKARPGDSADLLNEVRFSLLFFLFL